LPNVRGLSLTLGEQPTRSDIRFHPVATVLAVLDSFRGSAASRSRDL